jgi:hypothetical protein
VNNQNAVAHSPHRRSVIEPTHILPLQRFDRWAIDSIILKMPITANTTPIIRMGSSYRVCALCARAAIVFITRL